MQRHFDRDIDELKHLLLRMGAMVEDAMARSIRALLERDTALANEVIARDDEIDRMEIVIDQKTIELIAELKQRVTIVIVTHNMQQAARVSDKTAFMYLGELIEFDETNKIFTSPNDRRTQDYITGRFG